MLFFPEIEKAGVIVRQCVKSFERENDKLALFINLHEEL